MTRSTCSVQKGWIGKVHLKSAKANLIQKIRSVDSIRKVQRSFEPRKSDSTVSEIFFHRKTKYSWAVFPK